MSELTTTYNKKRKLPINRNNMFYSEEDFLFETELGKNYLEEDVNQTVILYQVDLEKSNLDTLYNEAKKESLVFKTPVELHVLYEIEEPQLLNYEKTKNLGTYVKGGKLKFGVFQSTLDELECDIKIGDYIGVAVSNEHIEKYVVVNDGRNNYDNKHMTFGYKAAYRSIECAPVSDEKEIEI